MTFVEHLANFVLGNVAFFSLPTVATQALVEGYDSRHLRMLAGLDEGQCNSFQVEDFWRRSLSELQLPLPSREEAARLLICYWARKIVEGSVTPEEGSMLIVNHVYDRTQHQNEKIAGDSLGISVLIGHAYNYGDLQEGFIEYEGKPITLTEAREILDRLVVGEVLAYLSCHSA
jgi:hypothetical protein